MPGRQDALGPQVGDRYRLRETEPHPDFAPARGHLGNWDGASAIHLGRGGQPFFVQGPDDDPARVLSALERSVGRGNYGFIAATGPPPAA